MAIGYPNHETYRPDLALNYLVLGYEDGVGLIQLNRPDVLNALSRDVMTELLAALEAMEADEQIGCIVLYGSEKAFAAGADIAEMAEKSAVDMLTINQFEKWERIRSVWKPIIAAVSGYALGGGCELSMLCDMIVASESAKFGQPEVNIGVMPGAGGTQRMTRAIGKARAMELILTGRMMGAQEAYEAGLVTKVFPTELYLEEAKTLAKQIAAKPRQAVRLAKEAVLKAFDTPLSEGLAYERRNFYMLFASHDQKEGMRAFLEKRPPQFTGS